MDDAVKMVRHHHKRIQGNAVESIDEAQPAGCHLFAGVIQAQHAAMQFTEQGLPAMQADGHEISARSGVVMAGPSQARAAVSVRIAPDAPSVASA